MTGTERPAGPPALSGTNLKPAEASTLQSDRDCYWRHQGGIRVRGPAAAAGQPNSSRQLASTGTRPAAAIRSAGEAAAARLVGASRFSAVAATGVTKGSGGSGASRLTQQPTPTPEPPRPLLRIPGAPGTHPSCWRWLHLHEAASPPPPPPPPAQSKWPANVVRPTLQGGAGSEASACIGGPRLVQRLFRGLGCCGMADGRIPGCAEEGPDRRKELHSQDSAHQTNYQPTCQAMLQIMRVISNLKAHCAPLYTTNGLGC